MTVLATCSLADKRKRRLPRRSEADGAWELRLIAAWDYSRVTLTGWPKPASRSWESQAVESSPGAGWAEEPNIAPDAGPAGWTVGAGAAGWAGAAGRAANAGCAVGAEAASCTGAANAGCAAGTEAADCVRAAGAEAAGRTAGAEPKPEGCWGAAGLGAGAGVAGRGAGAEAAGWASAGAGSSQGAP